MEITYDPAKRRGNLHKHGVDLAEAGKVFEGPTLTLADDRFNYGEPRFVTYGLLGGRLVAVVWTPRGEARRVISMRKCNDREQKAFRGRIGQCGAG